MERNQSDDKRFYEALSVRGGEGVGRFDREIRGKETFPSNTV
jgi:hypothetical protein